MAYEFGFADATTSSSRNSSILALVSAPTDAEPFTGALSECGLIADLSGSTSAKITAVTAVMINCGITTKMLWIPCMTTLRSAA